MSRGRRLSMDIDMMAKFNGQKAVHLGGMLKVSGRRLDTGGVWPLESPYGEKKPQVAVITAGFHRNSNESRS